MKEIVLTLRKIISFTLYLPFETKLYSIRLISFIKSLLVPIRVIRYKTFGMANASIDDLYSTNQRKASPIPAMTRLL